MDNLVDPTVWVLVPLLAVGLLVATARRFRSRREQPGGRALLLLATACGWWALMQAATLLAAPSGARTLFFMLQYLGVAVAPLGWFWFALDYSDRAGVSRGVMALVALVPAVTVVLAFTHGSHGALWRDIFALAGSPGVAVEHGPWFFVQVAYSVALVLAGTGVLLWHHAQSPRHRDRLLVVAAAPTVVLLPNAVHLSPLPPPPWLDLTPTGFAMATAVLGWGLLREGRLTGAPVARTVVVEEMHDPVVVLDGRGRIVDLNRVAGKALGLEPEGPLPVSLGTFWAAGRRKADRADAAPGRVVLQTASGDERIFEVTMTALGPRGGRGRTVLVLRDITERDRMERELRETGEALRHANAELERMAHTDSLTGLANRRAFMRALEGEVERSDRYGRPLSLIMLDLDHFKDVNDTHGHAAGDEVLRRAGSCMREVSRETDMPARLGGEELAILLPETDIDGALVMAERLREDIELASYEGHDGTPFRVTASLGVAALGEGPASGTGLLRMADEALYRAKDAGRNRVVAAGAGDVGSAVGE